VGRVAGRRRADPMAFPEDLLGERAGLPGVLVADPEGPRVGRVADLPLEDRLR